MSRSCLLPRPCVHAHTSLDLSCSAEQHLFLCRINQTARVLCARAKLYIKELAVKVKTEFMPDFQHFRFSYSRTNPSLGESARAVQQQPQNPRMSLSDTEPGDASPYPGFCFGDTGQDSLDSAFLSSSLPYLHPSGFLHRTSLPPLPPPPPAAALRNDLGSNISVLKTLNLRFRCFLAKVHELERRNKALENQLQQALEASNNDKGKRNGAVRSGPDFIASSINANDSACLTRTLLGPTLNGTGLTPRNKILAGNLDSVGVLDSNSNLSPPFPLNPVSPVDPKSTSSITQSYDGNGTERFANSTPQVLPTSIWFHNPPGRFNNSWELRVSGPRVSWPYQDGVGVQIDTITPEIRALNNVLAKVKLERDEYKQRSA